MRVIVKNGHHYHHHPRSVLAAMGEALHDPRDGRGAYSAEHIIMLREWKDAMGGDLKALISALKRAKRRSEREINAAKGKSQVEEIRGYEDWPSLLPVMELLQMVTVERREESVRWQNTPVRYRCVYLSDWFKDLAVSHPKSARKAKEAIEHWLNRDSVDGRSRSEESRMD